MESRFPNCKPPPYEGGDLGEVVLLRGDDPPVVPPSKGGTDA